VVESRPGRQTHIDEIETYTRSETFEYVLEADEYGKIIGGEWIGESRTSHPDFAWWPTGKPTLTQAGISYDELKSVYDESVGPAQPAADRVTLLDGYRLGTSTSKYVSLVVEPGYKKVVFTMTGTGDADLLVRKGRNPTVYINDCHARTPGSSNETCTVNVSTSGATLYVRARPRAANSTVTIVAEKQR
jgi:hypothetical protein